MNQRQSALFAFCVLIWILQISNAAYVSSFDDRRTVGGSTREQRFPSVEERVQIYMGNWYTPPCPNNSNAAVSFDYKQQTNKSSSLVIKTINPSLINNRTTLEIRGKVESDRIFFLDNEELLECVKPSNAPISVPGGEQVNRKQFKMKKNALILKNMRKYCLDVMGSLVPVFLHVITAMENAPDIQLPPLLVQFGDLDHSHFYGLPNIPYFKKYRIAATRGEIFNEATSGTCLAGKRSPLQYASSGTVEGHNTPNNNNNMQPIIWKLSVSRHYKTLSQVEYSDTPWHLKIPMAIFRGQLTGSLEGYHRHKTQEENCLEWRRCRLVYLHSHSALVDAKLTSTRKRMPDILNNIPLVGSPMSISNMMEYKAIIMLEGNDLASGLKWALLSQSVVLMPPPKFTSWAMEELLIPWVHYVPLNDDATDVEEKMQWIIDHDIQAQAIAETASLWIEDLCFHPNAAMDDRYIQEELIRRYLTHFVAASEEQ